MDIHIIADDSRHNKSRSLKKLESSALDRANASQSIRNRQSIKQADTCELRRLNDLSISKDYNRNLSDKFFRGVDPRGTHILCVMMIHEHAKMRKVATHYRCWLLAKMRRRRDPVTLILDLPIDTFNSMEDALG